MKIKKLSTLCCTVFTLFSSNLTHAGTSGWLRNDPGNHADKDSVLGPWVLRSVVGVKTLYLDTGSFINCPLGYVICYYQYNRKTTVRYARINDVALNGVVDGCNPGTFYNSANRFRIPASEFAEQTVAVPNVFPEVVVINLQPGYSAQYRVYKMLYNMIADVNGVMIDNNSSRLSGTIFNWPKNRHTEYSYTWSPTKPCLSVKASKVINDVPIVRIVVGKTGVIKNIH